MARDPASEGELAFDSILARLETARWESVAGRGIVGARDRAARRAAVRVIGVGRRHHERDMGELLDKEEE